MPFVIALVGITSITPRQQSLESLDGILALAREAVQSLLGSKSFTAVFRSHSLARAAVQSLLRSTGLIPQRESIPSLILSSVDS